MQDAIQGSHWNNLQCTIHPFVIYYKDQENTLCHQSFVVISESVKHDYAAVYQFQMKLIGFLKEKFNVINKIFFFSDGAAGQYKNKKNLSTLCRFKESFGIDVEWHFFATSHGKGPCDGLGGAFKRAATKASLQRPLSNQIVSAKDLFQFSQSYDSKMIFSYCTTGEYNIIARQLQNKFNSVNTIVGT